MATIPEIRTVGTVRQYLLDGAIVPKEVFEAHMASVVRRPVISNMMAGYRAKVRIARERAELIVLSPSQLELFLNIVQKELNRGEGDGTRLPEHRVPEAADSAS